MTGGNEMAEQSRFLRLPEVMHRVSLGKTAIYAMIKREEFPAPIKLGRASVWEENAVDTWIKSKIQMPAANDDHGRAAA